MPLFGRRKKTKPSIEQKTESKVTDEELGSIEVKIEENFEFRSFPVQCVFQTFPNFPNPEPQIEGLEQETPGAIPYEPGSKKKSIMLQIQNLEQEFSDLTKLMETPPKSWDEQKEREKQLTLFQDKKQKVEKISGGMVLFVDGINIIHKIAFFSSLQNLSNSNFWRLKKEF